MSRLGGIVSGVLAGIAMAVLGGAGVASAHAELLSSDPQPDEVLDTAPAHVTLRFTEPVEISLGAIRLFDGTGNPIDVGTAHHGCAERSRSKPFWPWRSSW